MSNAATKTFDLKALRTQNNLTQAKLAEMTGYPQSFISRMENGNDPTPQQFIDLVVKTLGISKVEGFISENPESNADENSKEIRLTKSALGANVKNIHGASEKTVSRLLSLVEERDNMLYNKEKVIQAKDDIISKKDETIERLHNKIDEMLKKIADLQDEIASLKIR